MVSAMDPILRKQEILEVKDLGERIGYGNMMDIASALWSKDLQDAGLPVGGAFVPAIYFIIKEEEQAAAKADRVRRLEEIKEALK